MTSRHKLIIGAIAAVGWLSQVIYFFPMPEERLDRYVQVHARAFDSNSTPTLPSENREAYLKRVRAGASDEFWAEWIISLVVVIFGLFAAFSAIKQWRGSVLLLMLSGLMYVVMWLIFTQALSSELSVVGLFSDMWKSARSLRTEVIFIHRDVALLALFSVLSIVTAVSLVAGLVKGRRADS